MNIHPSSSRFWERQYPQKWLIKPLSRLVKQWYQLYQILVDQRYHMYIEAYDATRK